jgi:MFS transporter, AAHS family, 4-hydroxybenzoate transporter
MGTMSSTKKMRGRKMESTEQAPHTPFQWRREPAETVLAEANLQKIISMEDLRIQIDGSPMSRAQWLAVGTAFLLAAVDGFDVLTMSFVAPVLRSDWHIALGTLGILLSSGHVGVALGMFLLAPVADLRGRRSVLLGCMSLTTVAMFLCAISDSFPQLLGCRVLVGLGIGGCIAVMGTVISEITNARRRPFAFALLAIGTPVGGAIGGLVSAYLLAIYSWSSVFLAGMAATLVLIPTFLLVVPEPFGFLATRTAPDRMSRINALLARLGHPAVDELLMPPADRRSYQVVFERRQLLTTSWATGVLVLQVLAIGFMTNWLPQLIARAGFPASTASLGTAVMSLAGIAGGALFGTIATPKNVKIVAACAAFGFGVSIIAFGLAPPREIALLGASALCGFFLFGQTATFQTLVAESFRSSGRASGIGFVLGMGRICGIAGPSIVGILLAGGASRATVAACFGLCAIIASPLILMRPPRPVSQT